MSVAYQMAMPILITNLGVEMIYVLCSRLKAQSIPLDKSATVINDVVISLFDSKFMSEIRKKQCLSLHQSIRHLFDKLAHSSIMRLNSTSMNKLYDLMLMSIKLQISRTKFPEEILQITLNHLNAMNEILNGFDPIPNTEPKMCLKENIDYINKVYTKFTPYDFVILRQTLLRFFQGKNVKVSLFIQECLQSNTGVIYLPMIDMAPPHVDIPGKIVEYNNIGEIVKTQKLSLTLSHEFMISNSKDRINCITTALGGNFYSGDRKVFESFMSKDTAQSKPNSLKINNEIASILKPVKSDDKNVKENLNSNKNEENKIYVNNELEKMFVDKDKEISTNNNTLISKASNNLSNSSNSNTQIIINANNMINHNFIKQNDNDYRKRNIEATKKEFNDLADFLNIRSSNDNDSSKNSNLLFKIDLFSSKNNKPISKAGEKDDDYDIIEIERDNNQNIKKVQNMFDDFNLKNNEEQDDLLELMDLACKN